MKMLLEYFFEVFNGGYHEAFLCHWCSGRFCKVCQGNVETFTRKATWILVQLVFRSPPPAPSNSKWTKTDPATDKFCLYLLGGLLCSTR